MLDVQEVIVVVKSELIKENDTPVFIQPREGPNPDEHTRTLTSANNAILWGGSRVQKNTWDERVIQERDDLKAMLIIYNLVVAMLRGAWLFFDNLLDSTANDGQSLTSLHKESRMLDTGFYWIGKFPISSSGKWSRPAASEWIE